MFHIKTKKMQWTCGEVEGQRDILSCGVWQQIFSGHQHSQELHAHARTPDGEEVPGIIGLQHTHTSAVLTECAWNIKTTLLAVCIKISWKNRQWYLN